MLDAHSLRAYPVPPLALLPLFTEIREGVFPETTDSPGPNPLEALTLTTANFYIILRGPSYPVVGLLPADRTPLDPLYIGVGCCPAASIHRILLVRHRAGAVAGLLRHRAGPVAGLLVLARPKDPAVGQVVQKNQQELARVLSEYQERYLAVAEHLKGLLLKG